MAAQRHPQLGSMLRSAIHTIFTTLLQDNKSPIKISNSHMPRIKACAVREASFFLGVMAGILMVYHRVFKPALINGDVAFDFTLPHVPIWAWVLAILFGWVRLVSVLRFRRLQELEQRFSYLKDDDLYRMNYLEAHEIMTHSVLDDCFWLNRLATELALIKTFAQADGTPLLVRTNQLSCLHFIGKRAEDTAVLLSEFVAGDIDSARGLRAISRVNVLHSHYREHIKMDEMIHTLGMFIFEPVRLIWQFEWRALTEMEQVARFVFWREVGLRMGIHGIPNTIPEYLAWIQNYELKAFRYADSNKMLADEVLNLFLRTWNIPSAWKNFLSHVAGSLLEDRVLDAIGWTKPPKGIKANIHGILYIRAFILRYFMLPSYHGKLDPLGKLGANGRYRRSGYIFEPWYVKANIFTRFKTWIKSLGRLEPGCYYQDGGYVPEKLGPLRFEELWLDQTREMAIKMNGYVMERHKNGTLLPFSDGESLKWGVKME